MTEIDLFKHELVPEHIVLTEEEKQEVMKKFGIKSLSQFPKILESDPAVIAIGAQPGDLIKIIRKSKTAGEAVYYRLVIEG